MTSPRLVMLDCETGGLDCTRHPLIQIAAIAVEGDRELEALEIKLRFDESKAEPEALALNHYNAERWSREAVEPIAAVRTLGAFLRRHATIEMRSKAGRPYTLARIAGQNVSFDMGFITALFKAHGEFLPAHYQTMDTIALALWVWHGREGGPKSYKLADLAAHLGVPFEGAHDALADVRATAAVARALLNQQRGGG